MKNLIDHLSKAQHIVLSTHRQPDGDGLGSQIAFFYALQKWGKTPYLINIDSVPKKYHFLSKRVPLQTFEQDPHLPEKIDLVIVFDTNDERMLTPLHTHLREKTDLIFYIDHHPLLLKGPRPKALQSYIDTSSASTGELTYKVIKSLGISMDRNIAEALYTSITFDTQLYKFVRSSPNSHIIAAELLSYGFDAENVHKHLFAIQSVDKMAFLSKALGQIEYFAEGKIALIHLKAEDLFQHRLQVDDTRDLIDFLITIDSIDVAIIVLEVGNNDFKVSLRSKGTIEVLPIAEDIGGGGHTYASGAYYQGQYQILKSNLLKKLCAS